MRPFKHTLLVAAFSLIPSLASAQSMGGTTTPQRTGYPATASPIESSRQYLAIDPIEYRRIRDLVRFMQTSERDAFDRIYSVQEREQETYLSDLRVMPREEPLRIAPERTESIEPSTTQQSELRSVPSEYLRRLRQYQSTPPVPRR